MPRVARSSFSLPVYRAAATVARRSRRGHADELELGAAEQAFEPALVADAAVLDAAERRLGLRHAEVVDPHHAGLQLLAEAVRGGEVARERVSREPRSEERRVGKEV